MNSQSEWAECRAICRRAAILAFVLFACAGSASSQDVSFQVRTRYGRTEFHVGEVILLDLVFAAQSSDTYQLFLGSSLPETYPLRDTFRVEPVQGSDDPLADFRNAFYKATTSGHLGTAGSSFISYLKLSPDPYHLQPIILNDYVRFSRPGVYTLWVQDSRVTAIRGDRMPLKLSNSLSLTILPADPDWQQNQVREAVKSFSELGQAVQSGARSYLSTLSDSCIVLRSLGTRETGAVMVDALRDESVFARCGFQAGIWEFPDKRFLVDQMKQLLKNTDVAITYTFFQAMTTASLLADRHLDQLFTTAPRKVDQQVEQEILNAVPAKQGSAKVATINTLVGISFARYGGPSGNLAVARGHISSVDSRVLRIASDNFDQLSPTAQRTILNYGGAQARAK